MKYFHLKALVEVLQNYNAIKRVKRIGDNRVVVNFFEKSWIFDVTKSNSLIFPEIESTKYANYSSPFDVNLEKCCNGASLEKVELLNEDKLLALTLEKKGRYKARAVQLIFELTGKHTNIVLVENEKIISALHLIGDNLSSREIKIGHKYTLPPKPNFEFKSESVEDIEEYLSQVAKQKEQEKLDSYKKTKIATIEKKIKRLNKEIDSLKSPEEFLEKSLKYAKDGETIFINLHTIKGYEKSLKLNDGEGNSREVELIAGKTPSQTANFYYTKSKRERSKAENLHIEKDSLEGKLNFYQNLKSRVEGAQNKEQIDTLLPPKQKGKEKNQNSNVQISNIDGLKVFVGTNERGNIAVLKEAKADDIWFHIKDIPSSHLIVRTDKKKVTDETIIKAAKLCVMYSTNKKDKFLVDYTHRRHVRTQERANVLYTHYKTVTVEI